MEIRSLGYRTDLIFARFDSEVTERGEYVVVRATSNPAFHCGNVLLFAEPHGAGDFRRWHEIFSEEAGFQPTERQTGTDWWWDADS